MANPPDPARLYSGKQGKLCWLIAHVFGFGPEMVEMAPHPSGGKSTYRAADQMVETAETAALSICG
jgi:hypothetical protein